MLRKTQKKENTALTTSFGISTVLILEGQGVSQHNESCRRLASRRLCSEKCPQPIAKVLQTTVSSVTSPVDWTIGLSKIRFWGEQCNQLYELGILGWTETSAPPLVTGRGILGVYWDPEQCQDNDKAVVDLFGRDFTSLPGTVPLTGT